MSSDARVSVQVSRRFAQPPERVFDAWVDPAVAGRWLFSTPTGRMVRAEVDARVGGRFTLVDQREGVDTAHVGEYQEIDRPRRLVFTFGVPQYSPDFTRVTVDIVPEDDGCELTLTHDGVLPEWADATRGGWATLLDTLSVTLG